MVLFQSPESACASRVQPARRLYVPADGNAALKARFLAASAPDSTPLVALHGISRNARAIWEAFLPLARAGGRALLVPLFDHATWPRFQRIGSARPDLALLDLLRQTGWPGRKFDLFGFSGGAQLAHRFAMLYPHRVACLHLAAPGWYCLPDPGTQWPEGLGRRADGRLRRFDAAVLSRLQLRAYLALPLRLWVGEMDVQRDASLRQSAGLDGRQGLTRLDRAFRYVEAFSRAARMRGIDPDVKITVLPGCGHDFTQCAARGGLAARVA